MSGTARTVTMEKAADHWVGSFNAMASPCQVLIDTSSSVKAKHLAEICAAEAWRIEQKFSRYVNDNIVHRINYTSNHAVEVDDETAGLIDFALKLYELSEGLFDITSGVLRKVWTFDGSDRLPDAIHIEELLGDIGFDKISWDRPLIKLQKNMQLDFGGIGKEYAVDRSIQLVSVESDCSCLINYGGDLAISRSRSNEQSWAVGIEGSGTSIDLSAGAIATSGNANRFLLKDGVRYSHILNPKTGWPVEDAPRSITVLADTCTQAGMLATLASLRGLGAEHFLIDQSCQYWAIR